jgi:predicted metal-dependent hydrolase
MSSVSKGPFRLELGVGDPVRHHDDRGDRLESAVANPGSQVGLVRGFYLISVAGVRQHKTQHWYAAAAGAGKGQRLVEIARDVEMLVRSLNEVASMFQDLAVLVQHQSDMLDSIEEHVETAGTYVKKGNEAMRAAIENQKKARKCWCCFILAIIIAILVTVSGVGAAFGVQNK